MWNKVYHKQDLGLYVESISFLVFLFPSDKTLIDYKKVLITLKPLFLLALFSA